MEEPTYKVSFTADYLKYKKWAEEGNKYWAQKIEGQEAEIQRQEKWAGKSITLSELPAFLEEMGQCVISTGKIEVYNDCRE